MSEEAKRSIGIRFLSIYNIVLGLLSVLVFPITIIMSKKLENVQVELSLLLWGLLPLVLLSIFYIISGISILKFKEWSRKCLLIASILQAVMGLYLTVENFVSPDERHLFINYILLIVGPWAIYYLRKPEVRSMFQNT